MDAHPHYEGRLLTFGELLAALAERMPGGRKPNHRWLREMRDALPYVPVPGARRRFYLIEPVWQYLCSLVVYPAPPPQAPMGIVHRRRGRPPKSQSNQAGLGLVP